MREDKRHRGSQGVPRNRRLSSGSSSSSSLALFSAADAAEPAPGPASAAAEAAGFGTEGGSSETGALLASHSSAVSSEDTEGSSSARSAELLREERISAGREAGGSEKRGARNWVLH